MHIPHCWKSHAVAKLLKKSMCLPQETCSLCNSNLEAIYILTKEKACHYFNMIKVFVCQTPRTGF